jgi:hypothetical protein
MGEELGYFSMAMGLTMFLGPFVGLKMVSLDADNTAFVICIAVSALNVACP